ncbi:MAG: adenylate/guanylate cyclase domain-containing protein, partial [Thainema sp.]
TPDHARSTLYHLLADQCPILFSDIRSFTKLSETMEPDENFKFINGYLDRMEPAIRNNHGFIDKYIGDAIMALFADEEGVERKGVENGVKAALGMLQALNEYNVTRNSKKRPPLKIGIGLHTGKEITLGVLGGKNRWDTTVIGRDVNKASRVEGLTKEFGSSLLVSKEVIEELEKIYQADLQQTYLHRYVGTEPVRGIEEPVDIYEIYTEDSFELRQGKQKTATLFQDALVLYKQQNYELALEKFKAVLADCRDDGAAQCYVRRCFDHIDRNRV